MAANPVLRWTKSPSANVNQYAVAWSHNGAAAGTMTVPQSAAADAAGYSTDFASANPGAVLKAGDQVSATVAAVDTVDNLASSPVSAGPVTIPAVAPEPPVGVTLSLS